MGPDTGANLSKGRFGATGQCSDDHDFVATGTLGLPVSCAGIFLGTDMLGAILLAATISLSQAERDADYDKWPMNTLHDCTNTPETSGDCRLPPALTAQEIQTRLGANRTAWWREGDELVFVAKRDTDQAYLCCSTRGRMDRVADDLWALRLRIVDIDRAIVSISVYHGTRREDGCLLGTERAETGRLPTNCEGMVLHPRYRRSQYLGSPRK